MHNPSVTVAISALNEETNIKRFLESVLKQKEDGFHIEKILVISDGSTDKTVEYARSFQDPRIDVVEHGQRLGQPARINEVFAALESDILIKSDADVVFESEYLIRDLIQPFMHEGNVGMCGGNPLPFPPETFTGKAIRCSLDSYLPLRSRLKGGHNVYSAMGCLLAYRKELAKKIKIPTDTVANDLFAYLSCLSLGYEYRCVPSAIVRYRLPQTLKDHMKQNTRFASGPLKMKEYFPGDLVDRELYIPIGLKLRYRIEQLIKHPILSVYIYAVNTYCRHKAAKTWRTTNAKWDMVGSTKA